MSRILIVDDEPIVLDPLRQLLEICDHQVIALPSADQAIKCLLAEKAAGRRFDLVLSDCDMPGKEGPEIYIELNRTAPGLLSLGPRPGTTRFVLHTGSDVPHVRCRYPELFDAPEGVHIVLKSSPIEDLLDLAADPHGTDPNAPMLQLV